MIGRVGDQRPSAHRVESLDAVIRDLRALRESKGASYRAIAASIFAQRSAAGVIPAAAKIAHTTVSDVFRLSRSRVSPGLVEEIALALGESSESASQWSARCVAAMASQPARRKSDEGSRNHEGLPALPDVTSGSRNSSALTIAVLVLGGVLLNATGKFFNPLLGDILFLDMIGTAVVALLVGPWWAALSGLLFMLIELLKGNVGDALFATTMITSGLIWGFGAKRWGMGDTLPRFLGLSVLVAVTTSLIAVPITVLYYGGEAGRGVDGLITSATAMGMSLWVIVGGSNLAVSLLDKVLTGAAAFYIAKLIRGARR